MAIDKKITGYPQKYFLEAEACRHFGIKLRTFKRWIDDKFDHTVILQADDPMVSVFRQLESKGHLKLQTFPLISSEGYTDKVPIFPLN